jgi:hypothetical protein
MRIDSDPRNLATGGDRFPVDLSLPQVPYDESDLDLSILVHEDSIDFDHAALAGLPPLFGRDEVEAIPPLAYEPGLDTVGGPAPPAGLAPSGLERDALDAVPSLRTIRGVAPFSTATAESDVMVARNAFAPFLDPFSFIRGDSLERLPRPGELRAPAPIGHDALETGAPDWDARVPLAGHDDIVFPGPSAATTATYAHPRDGFDRPPRAPSLLRI